MASLSDLPDVNLQSRYNYTAMPLRILEPADNSGKSSPGGLASPRLGVPWQKRGNGLRESLRVLFSGPRAPVIFVGVRYFRNCSVKPAAPRRSMAASVLWHGILLVLLIQFGNILLTSHRVAAMSNLELTWSGPIEDLPLISPAAHARIPAPPGDPAKPLPPRGADAFHPRQALVSAPKAPNHPRQTLVRPDAPPVPPKILPQMPNIVTWNGEPARPRLQIKAEKMLQQPAMAAHRPATSVASPDLPNEEKTFADIHLPSAPAPNLVRPALTISSGSATVAAPKQSRAASADNNPPPVIGAGAGDQKLIALSATPGPAMPAAPIPAGNVSANVSISPDGTRPGVPGGSDKSSPGAGGGAGGNGRAGGAVVPGITVSGGDPKGLTGVSGLGNSNPLRTSPRNPLVAPGMSAVPGSSAAHDASAADAAKIPISERLKSGAPPEHIFGDHTVYTMNVNNPNISSSSGSWVLKFAELGESSGSSGSAPSARAGTLSGLVALRKVDPRYPPNLMRAHIEGEVVLYAIIRADGSVDSIQVARSLDPVLDQNAMEALAQWKFTPATKNGVPVALEAIIHIPFRSSASNY